MTELAFAKMHGLGNDFVVIDQFDTQPALTAQQMRGIADRRHGVGFDQLLCLGPATDLADFSMSIYNADGSRAEQCGNGVRCVARYAQRRGLTHQDQFTVESSGRLIDVQLLDDDRVSCDMGVPEFEPMRIPFVAEKRAPWYDLAVDARQLTVGVVSMGNPHAVMTVADTTTADVDRLGALLESHERFPNRVNVGFMQVMGEHEVRLRVFERGVGETRACGTGACAAAVIGNNNGLLAGDVGVTLSGGRLDISWRGNGSSVWMTGPATWVYEGKIAI